MLFLAYRPRSAWATPLWLCLAAPGSSSSSSMAAAGKSRSAVGGTIWQPLFTAAVCCSLAGYSRAAWPYQPGTFLACEIFLVHQQGQAWLPHLPAC